MATGARVDPYHNFNYIVEIEGITQAGFSDCTGFGATSDPIEYREGGENTTNRKIPGQTKYPNITLKWGLTDSRELYEWYRDVTKGVVVRRNGSIIVNDLTGQEVARWNFYAAWPAKWDGPDFSAKANDIAIQTLEIAHEKIEQA